MKIAELCDYLGQVAPLGLAADWDNVGLLLGRRDRDATKALCCLTLTAEVVQEAIENEAHIVITHHPFPFRPFKRIADDDAEGRMLLDLLEHEIAVYSAHTAYDGTFQGINQQIARMLRLESIAPLEESAGFATSFEGSAGVGRMGSCIPAATLEDMLSHFREKFPQGALRFSGNLNTAHHNVGIACGSGGDLLALAAKRDCTLFVTGEMTFHNVLKARAMGMETILLGHYESERFGVEALARQICAELRDVKAWPSRTESNPLMLFA